MGQQFYPKSPAAGYPDVYILLFKKKERKKEDVVNINLSQFFLKNVLLPTNTKSSNSFLNMTHFLSLNINMFKCLNKIQIYRICR